MPVHARPLLALLVVSLAALAGVARAGGRERLSPDSRVSTAGLGPVEIGLTRREAVRAGGVRLRREGPALHGCRYLRPRDRSIRASFMVVRRRIVRVDVARRGIATVSGFRVGDRGAAVRRRFAGRLRVTRHEDVRGGWYLEVVPRDEPNRRVVFETRDGRVSHIRAGRLPEVRYVEGCA